MKDLVTRILDTTAQPDRWSNTLDLFNVKFEVKSSALFTLHEFNEFRFNFAWSEYLRKNLPPDIIEIVEAGNDKEDLPAYQKLMQLPAQKPFTELDVLGLTHIDELPKSELRTYIESIGLNMRIGTALNVNGPWMDAMFVHTTKLSDANRFTSDERNEFIMPIIAKSVSLGRTIQALSERYKAALSVLDNLGLGVFLVDHTGCVIEHNKEAQRIVDLDDGLALSRDSHLKLSTHEKTTELETMIASANGLLRGELSDVPNLISADRKSETYDYLISVRPLSDSKAELETGFKCAFVTVIDPTRDTPLSADGLVAMGNLSPAETSTVELLVQGFRLSDVADQRDVSMNTIKSQLKEISRKLRCSTQSDIIRIAAATRLPLGK